MDRLSIKFFCPTVPALLTPSTSIGNIRKRNGIRDDLVYWNRHQINFLNSLIQLVSLLSLSLLASFFLSLRSNPLYITWFISCLLIITFVMKKIGHFLWRKWTWKKAWEVKGRKRSGCCKHLTGSRIFHCIVSLSKKCQSLEQNKHKTHLSSFIHSYLPFLHHYLHHSFIHFVRSDEVWDFFSFPFIGKFFSISIRFSLEFFISSSLIPNCSIQILLPSFLLQAHAYKYKDVNREIEDLERDLKEQLKSNEQLLASLRSLKKKVSETGKSIDNIMKSNPSELDPQYLAIQNSAASKVC